MRPPKFNAKEFARAQAYDAIMARQRGRADQPEPVNAKKMTFFVKTFQLPVTNDVLLAFCSEGGTFQYVWNFGTDSKVAKDQLHDLCFHLWQVHKLAKLELLILNQQFFNAYGELLIGCLNSVCQVEASYYRLAIDNIAPGKKITRLIEKHYPQAKEITNEEI